MRIPAEVLGQMDGGCRAEQLCHQTRLPDAQPGELGGETQSVLLYIPEPYGAITMESGRFAFHCKPTHLIK